MLVKAWGADMESVFSCKTWIAWQILTEISPKFMIAYHVTDLSQSIIVEAQGKTT